jgi:hypothetical protein
MFLPPRASISSTAKRPLSNETCPEEEIINSLKDPSIKTGSFSYEKLPVFVLLALFS